MPTYVFEAKNGDRVEEYFPMSSVPRTIKRASKTYTRIIVCGREQVYTEPDFAHAGRSLHREWDVNRLNMPRAPRYDALGVAQFANRREIETFQEKMDARGYKMRYDLPKFGRKK